MSALLDAAPGLLLVLGLPGVLVLLIVRVRLSWVQALAAIPVCSIGIIWLLGEVNLITGLAFAPVAFWVLVAALAVLAFVMFARAGYRAPELVLDDEPLAREEATGRLRVWIALGLLVASVLLGSSIWLRGGIAGSSLTPPDPDAGNHGFAVARIMRTESLSPDDVLVSDLRFGTGAAQYYPLAMHAPLALAADITGASVASLLVGISVVFGAMVLPFGLYALTRFLVPDLPVAAGFAALFSQLLGVFPYEPYTWGGLTTVVGLAALPIVLVILVRTVTTSWSWRAMALSTLLVMALFAQYISVFVLLLFLVGLLVLERAWIARDARSLWAPVQRLAIVCASALVLAVPVVLDLTQGVSERSSTTPTGVLALKTALRQAVTIHYFGPPSGWLAGIAGLGIVILLWRRQLLGWILGFVVLFALVVLAGTSHGTISQVLTLPWYHQAERIIFNFVFFVPVFAAIALALGVDAVARRFRADEAWALAGGVVVTLVLVWVVFAGASERDDRRFLQAGYAGDAKVGHQQIAAFDYLARHAPKRGLVVVDGFIDEAQWMYAYSGVYPMWGMYPVGGLDTYHGAAFTEREYIQTHVAAVGKDPALEPLLRKYGVRYVYTAQQTYGGFRHTWSLAALRKNPRLREVFNRSTTHVFEILPPSGAAGA